MRKFGIGVAALFALLVATALIGPNLVDWNSYKSEILAQARAATGRDLAIDGDINFSVLPGLQLTAADVRFANFSGGSAPDMVRLKSLDIQVRLLPLLQGRIEAEAITFLEPVILLERLADGRVNWDLAGARTNTTAATTDASQTPSRSSVGILQGVQLDDVRIRRGTVIYRDAIAGTEERIAGLTVQLGVRSLSGPFRAKGDVILRGVPISIDAAVGALKPADPAPINFQITVPAADTRLELSGGAVITGDTPRFTGKLTISGKDMRRLAAAISGRSRNTLPSALAQPFYLKALLQGTDKGGTVENIEMDLGGARADGALTFANDKRFRAAARVRLSRIDIDEWVKAAGAIQTEKSSPVHGAEGPSGSEGSKTRADFALPDINVTLDTRIDAITYNRQNLRNILVKTSLVGGVLRLDQGSALLPGGGEATFTGQLSAQDGKPSYTAKLDGQADNLRAALNWLGVDVSTVPASRLRKFAFSAAVSGDDRQLQILETKVSVDTTRIDGGVTIALRDRPAFGATVNVDNIDLDAYVLPESSAGTTAASKTAAQAPVPTKVTGDQGALLAGLNEFDANVRLQIGRLKVQQVPVRDLRFDGTLVGGELTIRNVSVLDVGGARAAVTGTLTNFAGIPVFKGTVSADAEDSAGLLKLAGIAPSEATRSLGALHLRGKADATADRVALDLSLVAAGATVKLAGAAEGLKGTPQIDANLSVDHKNFAQLMRAFGGETSVRDPGPVKISAHMKGGMQRLSASVDIDAAGLAVKSNGVLNNLLVDPAYDLSVTASHPNIGDFVRKFAPDYRPAGGGIGPLAFDATVKGKGATYTLSSLKTSAGKINLAGSGRLETSGVRPILTAELKAGEIDLNPFLPPTFTNSSGSQNSTPEQKAQARAKQVERVQSAPKSTGTATPADGSSGQRFSSEPFDVSGFGLMDATLSVSASALIYRQFRVTSPVIEGNLTDSNLTIKQIAGKMFDGSFNMAGKFDARRTPSLDGTVSVKNANVGKALFQAKQFDIQGGITDLAIKIGGSGRSPDAMIRSLNGSGSVSSLDGIVKGFDLKAVSDHLKNLDNAIDFISLFNASMRGGQTRFSKLNGTFSVRNGVLRNEDLRLVADAGEVRAAGTADLPRWHMDFNGQFHLTEHPNAPPFEMRAVGPIDNPNRIFKFDKLQAFLLQRGIGTLLRKVFPGGRPRTPAQEQQPQTQPQQQQPKKPRLEDLIPGLLKGLGR